MLKQIIPKVSVCIPTFNRRQYIAKAIESVLSQSFEDYELIIVDNDSNDGTFDEIIKYTDSRIKYIKNDCNIGLIPNWNRCLDLATGEYVLLLFSDDKLQKDCLEKFVNILEKHKNVGFVHGLFYSIDENDEIIDKKSYRLSNKSYMQAGIDYIKNFFELKKPCGLPSATMARREGFTKTGKFTPEGVDPEMWLRFSVYYDFYYLYEHIAYLRVHPASWTVSELSKNKLWFEYSYKVWDSFFNNNQLVSPEKKKVLDEIKEISRRRISFVALSIALKSILTLNVKSSIDAIKLIYKYDRYFFKKLYFMPLQYIISNHRFNLSKREYLKSLLKK